MVIDEELFQKTMLSIIEEPHWMDNDCDTIMEFVM